MSSRSPQLDSLRRAVVRFGRFRKRWSVLHGLALAVLALPGGLLAWFLLDWAFRLPAWPLLISFLATSVAGLVAAVIWIVRPLLHWVRAEREAVVIESLHGALDNQLIGSLQLGEELASAGGRPLPHSPEFVEILLERTTTRLAEFDVRSLLDLRRTKRLLLQAAITFS